jgi:hypothetical protein
MGARSSRLGVLFLLTLGPTVGLTACGLDDSGEQGGDAASDGSPTDTTTSPDTNGNDVATVDATLSDVQNDTSSFDSPTTDSPEAGGDADAGDGDASSRDATGDSPSDSGGGDGSADGPVDSGSDAGGDAADGEADAGSCGTCPTGFVCGPSNYCVDPNGVPAFGHVYVIVMENRSLSSIKGAQNAPYVNSLMTTYAYATNYTTTFHPSLPNYIAMTSGSTQGIGCDCEPTGTSACVPVVCLLFPNCKCDVPDAASGPTHLGDQLDGVGVAWREYAEGAAGPCDLTDNGAYALKHVPFAYYDDVQLDPARCALRVRPYSDFAADLAAGSYRFSYISPNLCDDMHDGCDGGDPIANGDAWLHANVPPILATAGFQAGGHDVLFIVWDEQDGSVGTSPIPLVIVSPLVKLGSTTGAAYNHYSLLATVEETFGVPHLGSAAAPINDVWK